MKNKIKMLLNFRGKKQNELLEIWRVTSKQSLTNKMRNERFDFKDIILLCDFLDMSISIKDNKTDKEIITFDMDDLKK